MDKKSSEMMEKEIALRQLRVRELELKKELAEAESRTGASEQKGWGHAYKVESYMLNLMFFNCLELSPAMNLETMSNEFTESTRGFPPMDFIELDC